MTDDPVTLADWRRRISELYGDIRRSEAPEGAWQRWRAARDDLFKQHPQSPIPVHSRDTFEGLEYYAYDPSARVLGELRPVDEETYEIATSDDRSMSFSRFARVTFELHGEERALELYWLEDYAGGLFLPFRDTTSGTTTYGAGRYLLDTAKGADLGMEGDRVVLDFNFAYNPSCSYDSRWACPLAPPPNRIDIAIEAGERTDR